MYFYLLDGPGPGDLEPSPTPVPEVRPASANEVGANNSPDAPEEEASGQESTAVEAEAPQELSVEEQAEVDSRKAEIVDKLAGHGYLGEGEGVDDKTREEFLSKDLAELEDDLTLLYEMDDVVAQDAKSEIIAGAFPSLTSGQQGALLEQFDAGGESSVDDLKNILELKKLFDKFPAEAQTPEGMEEYLIDQEIAINGGTREEATTKVEESRKRFSKMDFIKRRGVAVASFMGDAVGDSNLGIFIDNFLLPTPHDVGPSSSRESGHDSGRNISGAEFESKLKSGGEFNQAAILAALDGAFGKYGLNEGGINFQEAGDDPENFRKILKEFNEKAGNVEEGSDGGWIQIQKGLSHFYSGGKSESHTFDDSIKYLFQDMEKKPDKYIEPGAAPEPDKSKEEN